MRFSIQCGGILGISLHSVYLAADYLGMEYVSNISIEIHSLYVCLAMDRCGRDGRF